jgi:transposase
MDCTHALFRRWQCADRKQLGRKPDSSLAVGQSNWLFADSLRSGQQAAAIIGLVQLAKLNRLDLHAYLKNFLQRLPTQRNSAVGELLPQR